MTEILTTKKFWLDYWESKENLVFKIPNNYPFLDQLNQICTANKIDTLLEIGGFPGYYSVWANKYRNINATLLDFVVHDKILKDLEKINEIELNSVNVIETDLLNYETSQQFDLVISNGFIEHFTDTKLIIQKHVEQLTNNGILFVTLPNFKSINGWFQRKYDPENYSKHNISCMDINLLKKVCAELGLKEIEVVYNGKFMIWLEDEKKKPLIARIIKNIIRFPLKIFFKIIPMESKSFSPYIVIKAKK